MPRPTARPALRCLAAIVGCAVAAAAAVTPVAEGLASPVRLTRVAPDLVLVAEGGAATNAGRVTALRRDGDRYATQPLLTGLPTGFDPNAQTFLGPADTEPLGNVLFVLIGIGDARYGAPGSASSPILSSVLQVVFSRPVSCVRGTVALDRQDHDRLAAGGVVLKRAGNAWALVRLLADLPDVIVRDGEERRSNPYDMERIGRSLYVTDAARNDLVAIDIVTGAVRTVVEFDLLPNGDEPVPTGMERIGGRLLVALEGGVASSGGSQVRVVDPSGADALVLGGLTNAVDVDLAYGALHVLELTSDFASFAPGRLLRVEAGGGLTVVTDELLFPSSMLPERGGWLVTQPFLGNVVLVDGAPAVPTAVH